MKNETISVNKNISYYGATFSIIKENRICLSELTVIDKEILNGYLDLMSKSNDKLKKIVEEVIEKSDMYLYYNRLNVPISLRGNGYGKLLLKETLKYCDENNILLLNTANNYGDMGQTNLVDYYEKAGMTVLMKSGLLVYHTDLREKIENTMNKKKSLKVG